ncbi:hypothetical protein JCM33374_g5831 [Metschnikowia sp. JCM 33374]|nr:hypothetical protein JCM33374_g5831 [Metschnikowia sp. JCM 33374]
MTHTELDEELDAIDAIYPHSIEKLGPGIVQLAIPDFNDISIQLAFPETYPLERPSVIQVKTKDVRKYPDVKYVESKVNDLIENVFIEEMVIIFELLGEIQAFLETYEEEHAKELQAISEKMEKIKLENRREKLLEVAKEKEKNSAKDTRVRATKDIDYTAGWTQSDPIVDRASSFIAFAREAHSVEEAHSFINDLTCDRKIARATHNMTSMRIKGPNGTSFQDCDDDGETAAGSRMLHLMTVC